MATERRLTAEALLRVWDSGAGQRPLDRALTILAVACPDVPPDRLAALSVGHRDAALLAVRRATFGPTLHGFVECPACHERLTFALDADGIRASDYPDPSQPDSVADETFVMDGFAIRFRLPDSRALAAVATRGDVATGRATLLRRCLLEASRDGMPVAADDLPDQVVVELGRRMAESDPQAEVLLDLACPACRQPWQAPFDIVPYFWAEIAAEAKRLLREVDALARAYGWREADILAMSGARRRSYLELRGA